MLLREWMVIAVIVGFLAAISVITKCSEIRSKNVVVEFEEELPIMITLSGAVKVPGIYYCPPGTMLKKVLERAGVSSCADRKNLPLKKVLLVSQSIDIPEKMVPPSKKKKISLEENQHF